MATRTALTREITNIMEAKYSRTIAELEAKVAAYRETCDELIAELAAARALLREAVEWCENPGGYDVAEWMERAKEVPDFLNKGWQQRAIVEAARAAGGGT
jgi:hypothetical protein